MRVCHHCSRSEIEKSIVSCPCAEDACISCARACRDKRDAEDKYWEDRKWSDFEEGSFNDEPEES